MATPLIVLPGALGGLEGSALTMGHLGAERLIATLDYRPGDHFEALLERIAAAADALGGVRFDLLGQSYGGWIAQCAAARWPNRVRRMVLSHSFALDPGDAKFFALGERVFARLPRAILAPLLRSRIRRALRPVRLAMPGLYRRQDEELARTVRSARFIATLIAQQRCLRESLEDPGAATAPAPAMPVLIIESDNDPIVGASARARLRRRCPAARVLCFGDAGHVSAIVEVDAFVEAVRRFIDD